MFSAQRPVHTSLRSIEARLATFNTPGREWQGHYIEATPRQLAEAGFFYIGESDRVKCWHCNGGLCNWLVDDDPLTEHSKWYPRCEFLLQLVGPQFVHDVVASAQANGQANTFDTTVHRMPSAINQTSQSIFVENHHRRVREYLSESQSVSTLRRMGFADVLLRTAVERHVEQRNELFHGLDDLLDAVVRLPSAIANENSTSAVPRRLPSAQSSHRRRVNSTGESSGRSSSSSSEDELLSPSIEYELEQLRQARMCRDCRREPASVVFLPCGHLSACSGCALRHVNCPTCGSRVSEQIRSFIV